MTVAHLPTRPAKFFDPATEVHFDDVLDTWNVFSLADVQRVLAEEEHFSASTRSEEHTSELQSQFHLVCRLLLEKKHKGRGLNLTWEVRDGIGRHSKGKNE